MKYSGVKRKAAPVVEKNAFITAPQGKFKCFKSSVDSKNFKEFQESIANTLKQKDNATSLVQFAKTIPPALSVLNVD